MEDEKACGPVLPDVEPTPPAPAPAEGVPLFPVGTKVIDISKDVEIAIQTGEENKILGGGYCVMWMLYLAIQVVRMDPLWKEGVPYESRREAYYRMYYNARLTYTTGSKVSAMADSVRKEVDTFNGKTKSTPARIVPGKVVGTKTDTKGSPFVRIDVMAPTVTVVKKIIRGEKKKDDDGDVEVGGGAGGGGGGRFYAPSKSSFGYDMYVKSLIEQPQMVSLKLRELIEKGDKPVIFNILMRKQTQSGGSHALLAIYFPAAFTGGVPEVHVLSTYPIHPIEIENIRTIRVAAKAGRRRRTFKKTRRSRRATRRRSFL